MATTGLYSPHVNHPEKRIARNILLAVILVLFALLTLFPIFYMIMSSFGPAVATAGTSRSIFPRVWTLDSYKAFFAFSKYSVRWIGNSLIVALATVAGNVVFASMAGYAFSKIRFKGRRWLFGLILVVSSDLGSALIFFFIFLVMLFAAGFALHWFAIGFAAIAAMIPLLWKFVLHDYQKNRILAPYDSSIDPTNTGINWQPHQSKIALASGQWTGAGLGHGTQSQSNALAGKHTDFIYAVIGEELGMIACILVIVLLLIVIIRCVMVGIRSGSNMGSLVCFGVAAFLTFQTFENIGMCIGITPVIGITLPFFSYGGSSLFTTFAALGMVSGIHFRPRPKRNNRR